MFEDGRRFGRAASRLASIHTHISRPLVDINKLDKLNFKVAPLVQHALAEGLPVVAFESTIISHGMPYPQNLETAKEVEMIVKDNGAVPATIAILNGVPHIGLTALELEELAKLGPRALKTARRDIAYVVAMGANGATTVSATMFFAAKETQGVAVAAYNTEEFPAFFTQKSGCKVSCRVNSPEECAKLIDASIKLGLGSGILIGVPIPETSAASGDSVELAIQTALAETAAKGITGNAVTPYILMRVSELTGGASLASNIALIKNNALVGAKVASCLMKFQDS